MRRTMRKIILLSFSVVLVTLLHHDSSGQTIDGDLTSRSITLQLRDATLIQVLGELAVYHRIPIGLELSTNHKDTAGLSIRAHNSQLKEVLDSITQQDTNYKWELRDGVINFVPAHSRDQFLEQLLNTRIRQFIPKKGSNKFALRNAIMDLPEVRELLKAHNMVASKLEYLHRDSIYLNNELDLSIFDTNIRGVLNKISKVSEHNMWVLQRRDKNRDILHVTF